MQQHVDVISKNENEEKTLNNLLDLKILQKLKIIHYNYLFKMYHVNRNSFSSNLYVQFRM